MKREDEFLGKTVEEYLKEQIDNADSISLGDLESLVDDVERKDEFLGKTVEEYLKEQIDNAGSVSLSDLDV